MKQRRNKLAMADLKQIVDLKPPKAANDELKVKPVDVKHFSAITVTMSQDKKVKLILSTLCEKYPDCFNLDTRKPLKIGIQFDIFSALEDGTDISKPVIKKALKFYTQNRKYLKTLITETHRIDLTGKPVEKVEVEHKAHAKKQLKLSDQSKQAHKNR